LGPGVFPPPPPPLNRGADEGVGWERYSSPAVGKGEDDAWVLGGGVSPKTARMESWVEDGRSGVGGLEDGHILAAPGVGAKREGSSREGRDRGDGGGLLKGLVSKAAPLSPPPPPPIPPPPSKKGPSPRSGGPGRGRGGGSLGEGPLPVKPLYQSTSPRPRRSGKE